MIPDERTPATYRPEQPTLAPRSDLSILGEAVAALNADELRVLTRIAVRLRKGRDTYGPLVMATDERNWIRELLEELNDAVVYSTVALEKLQAGTVSGPEEIEEETR